MVKIVKTIKIKVPIYIVFNWLTNLDRHYTNWHPAHKKFKIISEEPFGIGTTFCFEEKIGGIKFKHKCKITEWIENEKISWCRISMKAGGSFILRPIQEGTELTQIVWYEWPYSIFGKIIGCILERVFNSKRLTDHIIEETERLKPILEKYALIWKDGDVE